MKVYIIEEGEYSDRMIIGVFLDKKKADNFARYHYGSYVSEYDTDDEAYSIVDAGYYKFYLSCLIRKNDNGTYSVVDVFCDGDEYNLVSEPGDRNIEIWEDLDAHGYSVSMDVYIGEKRGKPKALEGIAKKALYDKCAEIEDLLSQGHHYSDIETMLNSK